MGRRWGGRGRKGKKGGGKDMVRGEGRDREGRKGRRDRGDMGKKKGIGEEGERIEE